VALLGLVDFTDFERPFDLGIGKITWQESGASLLAWFEVSLGTTALVFAGLDAVFAPVDFALVFFVGSALLVFSFFSAVVLLFFAVMGIYCKIAIFF
jgi:hypothetical protein